MDFYEQFKSMESSYLELDVHDPLNDLRAKYKQCRLCSLCKNRNYTQNMVFGSGVINPRLMVVGTGPSKYDSEVGVPFSDKLGDKLRGMLEYVNSRVNIDNNIYLTSLALCPGNHTIESFDACYDRLHEELVLVSPKVLLFLGNEVSSRFVTLPQRGKKLVFKLGEKYYTGVQTHTLKDLVFRNSEVRYEVKEDLDLLVEIIRNEENLPVKENIRTI